jgi:hypothetical protein
MIYIIVDRDFSLSDSEYSIFCVCEQCLTASPMVTNVMMQRRQNRLGKDRLYRFKQEADDIGNASMSVAAHIACDVYEDKQGIHSKTSFLKNMKHSLHSATDRRRERYGQRVDDQHR